MTSSNDTQKQDDRRQEPASIWPDDEERRAVLFSIFERDDQRMAREDLADLLVLFREELPADAGDQGVRMVADELDNLIGLLFQKSEAYSLALKLYAGRYRLVQPLTEILREVIEKELSPLHKSGAETTTAPAADTANEVSTTVKRMAIIRKLMLADDETLGFVNDMLEIRNRRERGEIHDSPQQQMRRDIFKAVVLEIPDASLLNVMHRCLTADDATLERLASVIDETPAASTETESDEVTAEQAEVITEMIVKLVSMPLPNTFLNGIRDALNELGNDSGECDTSTNIDLLRVWLPKALRKPRS